MTPIYKSPTALAALALLAFVAACAQPPDAIAPVSMGNAFAAISCRDAQTMLTTETQTLASLSAQQQAAVTGDALGVLLLSMPISSMTGGDVSGLIGATKGKLLALQARLISCAG